MSIRAHSPAFSTLIFIFVLLGVTSVAFGQGSTFTYQGRLTDGGTPANGTYDLQFKLYDGSGNLQGSPNTVTKSAVLVTNGIFTVQLDFGVSAFPGADRFLDISVKHPSDSSFTPLLPRQQLTATPYALRTSNATAADGLSSACILCVTDGHIQSVDGSKVTGTVANAAQLGGISANQYVLTTDPRMSDARSPLSGSDNYIQNGTNEQPANFNMFGSAITRGSSTGVALTVNGTQPPPSTNSNGIDAAEVLQVVGAKGGNTLATGIKVGGTGGRVLIQAGDGGDGPLVGGAGGSITLQPGAAGNGPLSSFGPGSVVLAPSVGNVTIGPVAAIGPIAVSQEAKLQVFKSAGADFVGGDLIVYRSFGLADDSWHGGSLFSYLPSALGHDVLAFGVSESTTAPNTIAAVKMVVSATGNVGIATDAPDNTLTVNGTADKPGGGSWGTFSDERLKNIKGLFAPGLKAVMQLQPLRYEYKPNNALGIKGSGEYVGFSAQAVERIIPEAVTKNDKGYRLVNNDPILWTMLNAIKEQQAEIVNEQTLIQSQQKLLETQQQQIDALKKLVCATNPEAAICKN